jgi:cytochrome P450
MSKRRHPGEDLPSALADVRDAQDRLTESELLAMAFMLLAGHETTVGPIGNGVLALLVNDCAHARLRADLSLLPNAVEEFRRHDNLVTYAHVGFTAEPVDIGGMVTPKAQSRYCLGTPLARLEVHIAFSALVDRFPGMRLAIPPTELRWRGSMVRSLEQLSVRLA